MEAKHFTLISQVCLMAASLYCLVDHVVTPQSEIGTLSFLVIASRSTLGAWKTYDSSSMPDTVAEVKKYMDMFADAFVLSFAAAEIWEKERVKMEIVVLQMLLPFLPVALYISGKDYSKTLEYVILGSLIALVAASVMWGSVLGLAAAAIFAAGTYYVSEEVIIESVPKSDMKNYVDAVFCLFLTYTLNSI